MSDSPSVSSRPTESELDLKLAELVNWQIFATHLPDFTRGDIEQIEQDNHDVQRQKLELYGTWLRRCPNASWNDIVLALEKARENTLADIIKRKFIPSATEVHNPVQPSKVDLEVDIVEELKKLHRSFTSLARDIRSKLDALVKSGKSSLHDIVAYIEEAQVSGMKRLTEVNTIDDLFDAIRPYNDYLDCELLEMIVEEYLDDDDITKVKAHIDKVKLFKLTTPIKDLKNKLQEFTSIPNISDIHLIVTIKFQAGWGRVTIDFIEKLVQNLLDYRHKVRILNVEYRSISVMLLLPKEMLHHFIVCSSQKLQFMHLIGIFRLQIGDITVFEESKNKNFTFESAFLQSSQCGDNEAVQLILDLGVNVDYSNSEGQTALILASNSGKEEFGQTLLSAGANINHKDKYGQNKAGWSAASRNGHLQVVELLLKENADPNVQNLKGWTALIFASRNGDHQVVEALLKKGANPNIHAIDGLTAIIIASINGHLQVVALLLKACADPNLRYEEGWTALMFASLNGHLQLAKLLLKEKADCNARDNKGWTALMFASLNGRLQIPELLLKEKADPNAHNNKGETPLMLASQNGDHQLAELLLKKKADPNAHDNEGWTALMFSSDNGHLQLVELLLEEKAHPNAHDNEGWTALMFASQSGCLHITELLLKENADPNVRSNTGWTALLLASKNGHSNVVVMLLQYKANPHVEIRKHLDSFVIATIECNIDILNTFLNHSEISFESLSMGWYYACRLGHVRIITLLSSRVDIVSDQTDLIISCAEGDLGTVIDQLLSGKITPDVQFIHGVTPLMISSSCGHTDIVEALIQSDANINKTDELGYTALDYAEQAKQDTTRVLLLQYDGLHGIDLD